MLLLLAVGPLLLLAPWWPLPSLVVAPLMALAAVYLAFVFALGCSWWAKRQQELTAPGSPPKSRAHWQAGRWDIDPRHAYAYLANVGDTTAYDVTVTVSGEVVCLAEAVPPFSAERLSSSAGLPCYLNLPVRQGIRASSAMTAQSSEGADTLTEMAQAVVRVNWRTASGEWQTQSATVD